MNSLELYHNSQWIPVHIYFPFIIKIEFEDKKYHCSLRKSLIFTRSSPSI